MSWIESHQELRRHPKTEKAARLLDASTAAMVGHLHFLWWWSIDYAPDGNLTDYDPDDIATAAGWEGDPDLFLEALIGCGPGLSAGFVDKKEGVVTLHDWDEFGGKQHRKRQSDAARKRAGRVAEPPLTSKNTDVRRTSDGQGADVRRMSQVEDRQTGQTDTTGHDTLPPAGGVTKTVDATGFDNPFPVKTRDVPLTAEILRWASQADLIQDEYRSPLADAQLAVSTIKNTIGKDGEARTAATSVVGDYLEAMHGPLASRAWGMLASAIANNGPTAVLSAIAEALERGAGRDGEHEAKGPVATIEYALAIIREGNAA